jgi:hypothetical protein
MTSVALFSVLNLIQEMESSKASSDEIIRAIKDICTDAYALETMSPCVGVKRVRSMSIFDKDFEQLVSTPATVESNGLESRRMHDDTLPGNSAVKRVTKTKDSTKLHSTSSDESIKKKYTSLISSLDRIKSSFKDGKV